MQIIEIIPLSTRGPIIRRGLRRLKRYPTIIHPHRLRQIPPGVLIDGLREILGANHDVGPRIQTGIVLAGTLVWGDLHQSVFPVGAPHVWLAGGLLRCYCGEEDGWDAGYAAPVIEHVEEGLAGGEDLSWSGGRCEVDVYHVLAGDWRGLPAVCADAAREPFCLAIGTVVNGGS